MGTARDRQDCIKVDGQDVPLIIRRDGRARRFTLSVDQAKGDLRLVLPRRAALREGLEFVHSKQGWIEDQLAALPPHLPFVDGAEIPILGEPHRIRHLPGARRGVWRAEGAIWVSGQEEHLSRRVTDFLKAEAREALSDRARAKAAIIDRKIVKIAVRDTRSRWGSCSSDGYINFSWRLILAPEPVFDYVVAHEVAHLVHLDHSRRFWALVDDLTPETLWAQRWLKRDGSRLLRYG